MVEIEEDLVDYVHTYMLQVEDNHGLLSSPATAAAGVFSPQLIEDSKLEDTTIFWTTETIIIASVISALLVTVIIVMIVICIRLKKCLKPAKKPNEQI